MLPRAAIARRKHVPAARPGVEPGGARQSWPARATALMRRHWLICLLLAAGLVLRVLAQVAYQPALIYVDTLKYLYGAYPGSEPLGYTAVLRLILLAGDLSVVAAIQHLLGLAMAVVLYAVLLRRGAARWLAALAAAPVLLDAYQLHMEQMIMPDVWFEAMILAALAVLVWKPAGSLLTVAAAGLILGSSAVVKQLGEILVLPALLAVLATGGGWRRAIGRSAALLVAFALPVLGYCTVSYAKTGHFRLAHSQPSSGRLTAAADCAALKARPAVRALCPSPAAQALGPDWLEHSGQSPLYRTPLPPGAHRGKLISELDRAIARQQPARVAVSILRDSLYLFRYPRGPIPGVTPISRWQFQASYPVYPPWVSLGPGNAIIVGVQHQVFAAFHHSRLRPAYGGPAQVNRPIARFLGKYQRTLGYTPGPLLALLALAGLAGSVIALARRPRRADRAAALACLAFTGAAAVALLVPDVYQFSWRYQLPAVVLLPAAGVLGACAMASVRPGPWSALRERREAGAGGGEHVLGGPGPAPQAGGDAPHE